MFIINYCICENGSLEEVLGSTAMVSCFWHFQAGVITRMHAPPAFSDLTTMTTGFPNEVLLKIVNEIPSGSTKALTKERNILAFQLANKQCFRMASEVLYKSVDIPDQISLHRFLHTVLHYPSYANLVENLKLDYATRHPSSMQAMDTYSHTYDAKMLDVIQLYNLAETQASESWQQNPPTQHQRFNTTKALILLCSLPRLQSLYLTLRSDASHLMARFGSLTGHYFPNVRVLTAEVSNTKEPNCAAILSPLFSLHPVKTLVLRNMYSRGNTQISIDNVLPRTSAIKKIVIWAHMSTKFH